MEQWMVVYPDSNRVFTSHVPMKPFAPVTHTAGFLFAAVAAAAAAGVGGYDIFW